MLVLNQFYNHISTGPPEMSPDWFLLLLPGCRWCILDVMARLPTSLPIPLCVPNLSTRDALLCTWSVAGSNCRWVPRLWHLALKPTISSQGCWSRCPYSYSCVCHPYSGMLSLLFSGHQFCRACGQCFPWFVSSSELYLIILSVINKCEVYWYRVCMSPHGAGPALAIINL